MCQCLTTKVLSEKKKIVRCLDKYAYIWVHLVIRYSFGTRAHTVSVILFSDTPPAQSFVFLNSLVWSLNYFILPTKASNLLSLVLHKCTCRDRPIPNVFILLFFLFCFVEEKNPTRGNFLSSSIYHYKYSCNRESWKVLDCSPLTWCKTVWFVFC